MLLRQWPSSRNICLGLRCFVRQDRWQAQRYDSKDVCYVCGRICLSTFDKPISYVTPCFSARPTVGPFGLRPTANKHSVVTQGSSWCFVFLQTYNTSIVFLLHFTVTLVSSMVLNLFWWFSVHVHKCLVSAGISWSRTQQHHFWAMGVIKQYPFQDRLIYRTQQQSILPGCRAFL